MIHNNTSKNWFALLALLFAAAPLAAQSENSLSEAEAEALGTEIYIYGYPLVTMDTTRRVMTNVERPDESHAPMGQILNATKYPDASFKEVTAPNADTLYSIAWLDLSKEPYILHVPDENGRFYLMPMISGWTEVFAVPGTRTTGTKEANFAITGPQWQGTLPEGVREYKSPTNMVWIIGRTYCTGTPEDYKRVHEIQNQYTLTPLSFFGKPYTPPKGVVDPNIDMKTPVREQVNSMDAATYFNRLAILMQNNPPSAEDVPMVAKMAKIGLILGQGFDINQIGPSAKLGLERAPKIALEKIMSQQKKAGTMENGWLVTTKTGIYGTDYLQRAYVTAIGLGANRPQDAVYPIAEVDSTGKPLVGSNRYVIHFDKGKTPPVKGFWSLTMYSDQYFFVDNPLNRYTLSPRDPLKYNPDGSLDLYLQNSSPGKDKEANWLPAPEGKFILMFRFYWPEETILNGSWKPPVVKLVE